MFESIFAFLFKYRPVVFERGDVVFAPPWPAWVTAMLGLGAVALAATPYLRLTGADVGRWQRLAMGASRFVVLALLVYCVSRPMLVIATVVPQQNFVGIVVDDSRSMGIADVGRARSAEALALVGSGAPIVRQLAERFQLRYYRFGESADRVSAPEDLRFDQPRTDLGGALDRARRDLASVPLAGLVVLTDGADNAGAGLDERLLELSAANVPVYTVGLGRERLPKDIELSRVDVPRSVLAGSSVAADVTVTQWGYAGRSVTLNVEDEGRIIASRAVTLPRDGEPITTRVHFTAGMPGARQVRLTIPPPTDDLVPRNNTTDALVHVTRNRERILYFEGEPRFEIKFLRHALAADDNLEVVTLLRTAEDKFLRLGVRDSTELLGGFPTTRQDLFQYRGIILGSVEASFFTHDQLQMLADFVSQRGGGLLVLGGRHAFGEGGYGATPLATALPVVLPEGAPRDTSRVVAEMEPELTPFGRAHPALQLASEPEASGDRWATLPALSTLNHIERVKAGASTLLMGERVGGGRLVMLAFHRFGRGKVIAFPVQDTWIWQMHAEIPLEDQTHETLWRQLLRWVVSGVPDPVDASMAADRTEVGRGVELNARVVDSDFLELNGAQVTATVTAPSGEERFVPLEWTVERNGEYRATVTPTEPGLHEVQVSARQRDETLGVSTTYLQAGDVGAEYFGVGMRRPLLERVANQTGGRFYTPSTIGTLPEDVSFTESGATVREERSLWDMPIVFLLVVGLVSAEWIFRRRKGLA